MDSILAAAVSLKRCLTYIRENEDKYTPTEIAAQIKEIIPAIDYTELYQKGLQSENYEFCRVVLDFQAMVKDIFSKAQAELPYNFIPDEKGLYVDSKSGNFGGNVELNGVKYSLIIEVIKEGGYTHSVIVADTLNDFNCTTLWSDHAGRFYPAPTSDNSITPAFISTNIEFWNASIKGLLKDYYSRY